MRLHPYQLAAPAAMAALALGCSPTRQPEERFNLDRPSAMAFGCYGDLRVTGGEPADPSHPVIRTAQPLTACQAWFAGEPPPGQDVLQGAGVANPLRPSFAGFVLQPTAGAVALVSFSTEPSLIPTAAVIDADPLSPGKNSIPIGNLPVDLGTTPSGCHLVSVNAGSCDMSVLEVNSALNTQVTPALSRLPVTAGGAPMMARPHAMAMQPPSEEVGAECPASQEGVAFVAYPSCNLVAAVDLSTGEVVAGIRFEADGSAVITDGDVSCANECGPGSTPAMFDDNLDLVAVGPSGELELVHFGGEEADAGVADAGEPDAGEPDAGPGGGEPPVGVGAPHPVTLHLQRFENPNTGQMVNKLFIGAVDSPRITIVDLGATYLPTNVRQVTLEGDIGIRRLSASPVVNVGGDTGTLGGGTGGRNQYVYAVATDETIRVAEVLSQFVECDAAVDARYLNDLRDVSFLACMPVGDPRTPPRRPGARSPGIVLPAFSGDVRPRKPPVPLDVVFATSNQPNPNASDPETGLQDPYPPEWMVGVFAFATASNGRVYVINVDDDAYPDFEDPSNPAAVAMVRAVPHQPRDWVQHRGTTRETLVQGEVVCGYPPADATRFGPRLAEPPVTTVPQGTISAQKYHLLPYLRSVQCTGADFQNQTIPVPELAFGASVADREAAFPDWRSIPVQEIWTVAWEGAVSRDSTTSNVDGPPVRIGRVSAPGGNRFSLMDSPGPFCKMGAQDYDIAVLRGCDPSRGNGDCGLAETCYVHPDSPESGTRGLCFPTNRADELAGPCRDLLISRRRYTVYETRQDELVLGVRRRILRTTPPSGCDDNAHCQQLYRIEREIQRGEHPRDLADLPDPDSEFEWVCAADPTRATDASQCLMVCGGNDDCETGHVCDGGYCVEGPIPPAACVSALQRYEVRVGEAFAVVGTHTGFLHDRVVDWQTGLCVDSADPDPLLTGRIPLEVPPCAGDGLGDVSPNPCATTIEQTELTPAYANNQCTPAQGNATTLRVRETEAIRFSNPVFTFHLADPITRGDAECRGDMAGTGPEFSAVYPGYELAMRFTAGFVGMYVNAIDVALPARIVRGPAQGLWVLDQGDTPAGNLGRLRGQLIRFDPKLAPSAFAPIFLR